jgi:hypothetical protein
LTALTISQRPKNFLKANATPTGTPITTLIMVAVPVICSVRQVILSTSGSPLISNLPAWIIPSPMTDNTSTHLFLPVKTLHEL